MILFEFTVSYADAPVANLVVPDSESDLAVLLLGLAARSDGTLIRAFFSGESYTGGTDRKLVMFRGLPSWLSCIRGACDIGQSCTLLLADPRPDVAGQYCRDLLNMTDDPLVSPLSIRQWMLEKSDVHIAALHYEQASVEGHGSDRVVGCFRQFVRPWESEQAPGSFAEGVVPWQ